VKFVETNSKTGYEVDGVSVIAIELSHRVPSHAFCFDASSSKQTLNRDKLVTDGIDRGPMWGEIQKGNDIDLDGGNIICAADYLDVEPISERIVLVTTMIQTYCPMLCKVRMYWCMNLHTRKNY